MKICCAVAKITEIAISTAISTRKVRIIFTMFIFVFLKELLVSVLNVTSPMGDIVQTFSPSTQ